MKLWGLKCWPAMSLYTNKKSLAFTLFQSCWEVISNCFKNQSLNLPLRRSYSVMFTTNKPKLAPTMLCDRRAHRLRAVRSFGHQVKPNIAVNGGPNLRRLSLPTRSFMFTCIVKIAQGDWNRRNLEPPSELYKDWNDTCKPNFEAFVEADMQVIPSPP